MKNFEGITQNPADYVEKLRFVTYTAYSLKDGVLKGQNRM